VLIDAVVARTELAMPPSITMEMAKGFSLFIVKAILSGRLDEIIDLAKTNLWRWSARLLWTRGRETMLSIGPIHGDLSEFKVRAT
jgi:hypothetical protein